MSCLSHWFRPWARVLYKRGYGVRWWTSPPCSARRYPCWLLQTSQNYSYCVTTISSLKRKIIGQLTHWDWPSSSHPNTSFFKWVTTERLRLLLVSCSVFNFVFYTVVYSRDYFCILAEEKVVCQPLFFILINYLSFVTVQPFTWPVD